METTVDGRSVLACHDEELANWWDEVERRVLAGTFRANPTRCRTRCCAGGPGDADPKSGPAHRGGPPPAPRPRCRRRKLGGGMRPRRCRRRPAGDESPDDRARRELGIGGGRAGGRSPTVRSRRPAPRCGRRSKRWGTPSGWSAPHSWPTPPTRRHGRPVSVGAWTRRPTPLVRSRRPPRRSGGSWPTCSTPPPAAAWPTGRGWRSSTPSPARLSPSVTSRRCAEPVPAAPRPAAATPGVARTTSEGAPDSAHRARPTVTGRDGSWTAGSAPVTAAAASRVAAGGCRRAASSTTTCRTRWGRPVRATWPATARATTAASTRRRAGGTNWRLTAP